MLQCFEFALKKKQIIFQGIKNVNTNPEFFLYFNTFSFVLNESQFCLQNHYYRIQMQQFSRSGFESIIHLWTLFAGESGGVFQGVVGQRGQMEPVITIVLVWIWVRHSKLGRGKGNPEKIASKTG